MGDMAETFRIMRQRKQEIRAERYKQNKSILLDSGIDFVNKGEAFLFREPGKPKVDFYPSTGRWKSNNIIRGGGAVSFLRWYEKQ